MERGPNTERVVLFALAETAVAAMKVVQLEGDPEKEISDATSPRFKVTDAAAATALGTFT